MLVRMNKTLSGAAWCCVVRRRGRGEEEVVHLVHAAPNVRQQRAAAHAAAVRTSAVRWCVASVAAENCVASASTIVDCREPTRLV